MSSYKFNYLLLILGKYVLWILIYVILMFLVVPALLKLEIFLTTIIAVGIELVLIVITFFKLAKWLSKLIDNHEEVHSKYKH